MRKKLSTQSASHLAQSAKHRAEPLVSWIEPLEDRRLFSTITVNYGGGDATGAIQAALNASQSGDTILFPAGTYTIGSQITVPGHRILQGNGAKLVAPGGQYCFQTDKFGDSNGDKFFGFEVVGRFLRMDAWAGWTSDVEIANNTFDPYNYGSDGSNEREGIYITNGGRNINIHNNTADGTIGDGWIVGYGAQGVNITDNIIENMYEGIHYLGQYGDTNGLTISRNLFKNNHTMNVEMQGTGTGVVIEGNIIQGAWITSNFNDNMNSFGFSLSGEGFSGTKVDHNKIVSYDRADGIGLREDFEIAGINPQVFQNDIEGTNQAGVLQTSQNGQIHDNRIVGAFQGFTAYDGRSPGANIYNNGPQVQLDWNPDTYTLPNAGASGSVFSQSHAIAQAPTPAPTPTPAPSSAVTNTTNSASSTGTWTVVGGQAALNGTVDSATHDVAGVFKSNGNWYQLNTSGGVWTLPGATAKNVTAQVTPPPAPKPAPTPTSTPGTTPAPTPTPTPKPAPTPASTPAPTPLPTPTPVPAQPPTAVADRRPETFLSDLASIDTGTVQRDQTATAKTLRLGGKKYANGLGFGFVTSPTSSVAKAVFTLARRLVRFRGLLGIDGLVTGKSPARVEFQLVGDGKVIYDSGVLKPGQVRSISVRIAGVKSLALVCKSGTSTTQSDNLGDWANARVS